MCRHPGPQLCPAPRRFGAAWSEFGTSRSHQQRAGAGHGARDWGHGSGQVGRRLWGLPECSQQPGRRFFRYLPTSPSQCRDCSGFWKMGISSHAHGRLQEQVHPYSSFGCLRKSPLRPCSPATAAIPRLPLLVSLQRFQPVLCPEPKLTW